MIDRRFTHFTILLYIIFFIPSPGYENILAALALLMPYGVGGAKVR
jgi:hypothetical protein